MKSKSTSSSHPMLIPILLRLSFSSCKAEAPSESCPDPPSAVDFPRAAITSCAGLLVESHRSEVCERVQRASSTTSNARMHTGAPSTDAHLPRWAVGPHLADGVHRNGPAPKVEGARALAQEARHADLQVCVFGNRQSVRSIGNRQTPTQGWLVETSIGGPVSAGVRVGGGERREEGGGGAEECGSDLAYLLVICV